MKHNNKLITHRVQNSIRTLESEFLKKPKDCYPMVTLPDQHGLNLTAWKQIVLNKYNKTQTDEPTINTNQNFHIRMHTENLSYNLIDEKTEEPTNLMDIEKLVISNYKNTGIPPNKKKSNFHRVLFNNT